MRTIEIQVSDEDYAALVDHAVLGKIGKPLVAVLGFPFFERVVHRA